MQRGGDVRFCSAPVSCPLASSQSQSSQLKDEVKFNNSTQSDFYKETVFNSTDETGCLPRLHSERQIHVHDVTPSAVSV